MFDLENESHGRGVLQQHSIANINPCKRHTWKFLISSHHCPDIHISNFKTLKMYFKVTMYNIRSDDIRWLTSCRMATVMFVFVNRYLSIRLIEKFDRKNLGQCHWQHHSQLCHSMANINLIKSQTRHVCANSYHFVDINILNFWSRKCRSRSRGRKTDLTPFDSVYQNAYKSYEHFCASSYGLRDIIIFKFWPWKCRPRSRGIKTGLTLLDSEYQSA